MGTARRKISTLLIRDVIIRREIFLWSYAVRKRNISKHLNILSLQWLPLGFLTYFLKCFSSPSELCCVWDALKELSFDTVCNSIFRAEAMVNQTESILSLLRGANRKCHKSTYPQADLWLCVWWIFRLTLSNPYCLDLAEARRLMSTGRQPALDVGNRDPTFDWAIDQRSLPFRQPLEGDLQIKERDLCHKWKCKPQKRKRTCVETWVKRPQQSRILTWTTSVLWVKVSWKWR